MRFLYRLAAAAISFGIFLLPSTAVAATKYFKGHRFEAHIVSDSYPHRTMPEHWRDGGRLIKVHEGQRYSIVVKNPLPIPVAAAVTVDGLNTIDGKRSTPAKGRKWIIDPHSSITISGWQTDNSTARKFYFTTKSASYAKWRESREGRRYSENIGVIGVAFFWDKHALPHYHHHHHHYYPRPYPMPRPFAGDKGLSLNEESSVAADMVAPRYRRYEKKAGTGMGHRQYHQVEEIDFHYNTGMYSNRDVLTIKYEFGHYHPEPIPFENDYYPNYRYKQNYTPEMP